MAGKWLTRKKLQRIALLHSSRASDGLGASRNRDRGCGGKVNVNGARKTSERSTVLKEGVADTDGPRTNGGPYADLTQLED